MPYHRILLFLSLILLLIPSMALAQNSGLRRSTCQFPRLRGVPTDCYLLDVPENRNDPDSNTISLSIAVLRSLSNNPEPDPIIFLQGGPGGSTLENLNLVYPHRFQALLATNRDIILFDQRGIGLSRPSLDCPMYRQLQFDLVDYEHESQVLTGLEVDSLLRESLIACGGTLSNIHDLSSYNSVENAADIEAIRLAFGYEQVNLWGISYGTRLALTAMRDYPDSFRRVVLDSVYPLEVNLYTGLPANFDRSLQVLFDSCEQDEACNQTFPNLESVLFDTISALNEQPVYFDAPNPYENETFADVYFDGDLLLRTIFQLLYSSDMLPRLPQLIYQAADGNFETWGIFVGWIVAQQGSVSIGMHYAVQCQEELYFNEDGSILAAWADFPQFETYSQTIDNVEQFQSICNTFDAGTSHRRENQAIQSDIPTLILTGEFDPITPPHWAAQVNETISHSFLIEFPNQAHGVSASQGCGQSIVIDYFNMDNASLINTDCVNDIDIIFSGTQIGDFNPPNSANDSNFSILALGS